LSVSFDPEHDTAGGAENITLRCMRSMRRARSRFDWQFASPSVKDLPELARFFGLVYQPGQAQIVHSLEHHG